MRMRTKLAILFAVLFIALGALLGLVVMLSIGFDFEALNTTPVYTTESKELLEPFESIEIEQGEADIKILASDAKFPVIQYMECEGIKYEVANENGVLIVREIDTRPWYKKISLSFSSKREEVATILHLPQKEYQRLHVESASGDVTVSDSRAPFGEEINETLTYGGLIRFSVVDIKTASGEISYLAELSENAAMTLQSASGDVTLKYPSTGVITLMTASGNVSVAQAEMQALVVKTASGDVEIKGAQATQGTVETASGEIFTQQFYCDTLTIETASGDVEMEGTHAPVIVRISTTSGGVEAVSCYAHEFYVETTSGDVELRFDDGIDVDAKSTSGEIVLVPEKENNPGMGRCYVETVSGDIYISRPPLPLWFN